MSVNPDEFIAHKSSPQNQTQTQAVLYQLVYASHMLRKRCGGGFGKNPILERMAAKGGTITQGELLSLSFVKAATISETLNKLENEKFIKRDRDPSDRRRFIFELTESGWEQAQLAREVRESFEAVALDFLSDDEVDELQRLLTVICDHWEEGECSCQTK